MKCGNGGEPNQPAAMAKHDSNGVSADKKKLCLRPPRPYVGGSASYTEPPRRKDEVAFVYPGLQRPKGMCDTLGSPLFFAPSPQSVKMRLQARLSGST